MVAIKIRLGGFEKWKIRETQADHRNDDDDGDPGEMITMPIRQIDQQAWMMLLIKLFHLNCHII